MNAYYRDSILATTNQLSYFIVQKYNHMKVLFSTYLNNKKYLKATFCIQNFYMGTHLLLSLVELIKILAARKS
jgi:hypothetical protein